MTQTQNQSSTQAQEKAEIGVTSQGARVVNSKVNRTEKASQVIHYVEVQSTALETLAKILKEGSLKGNTKNLVHNWTR